MTPPDHDYSELEALLRRAIALAAADEAGPGAGKAQRYLDDFEYGLCLEEIRDAYAAARTPLPVDLDLTISRAFMVMWSELLDENEPER